MLRRISAAFSLLADRVFPFDSEGDYFRGHSSLNTRKSSSIILPGGKRSPNFFATAALCIQIGSEPELTHAFILAAVVPQKHRAAPGFADNSKVFLRLRGWI